MSTSTINNPSKFISENDKNEIISFLDSYQEVITMIRLCILLRRIKIDNSIIQQFGSNPNNIINQIIEIIKNGLIVYQSESLGFSVDFPLVSKYNNCRNITIFDEAISRKMEFDFKTQEIIHEFLKSKGIKIPNVEFIDIETNSFFNQFNLKLENHVDIMELDNNVESNISNDIGKFYRSIKDLISEFDRESEELMELEPLKYLNFSFLINEISVFVSRINKVINTFNYHIQLKTEYDNSRIAFIFDGKKVE